jgi:hypothetical protein
MPRTPTGSDTRMYSPRSESNLGYSKDEESNPYGYGDPEQQELARDQKQAEQESQEHLSDLPHLQISIPKPAPEVPPMMPEEEEEAPMMDDQFNEGQQFGAMTGMPDMGNLSIGNATGTMPAPGGMLATGEPMNDAWSTLMKEEGEEGEEEEDAVPDNKFNKKPPPLDLDAEYTRYRKLSPKPLIEMRPSEQRRQMIRPTAHGDPDYFTQSEPMKDAWSTLMKARLDKVKGAKDKSWKQTQFEIQPGGSDITTANTRRAKLQSRNLQSSKKRGLDQAPLSVHRTHLGIETKQPSRLFPRDYGHQQATQARRRLMGNVPQIPAGHGLGPEQSYNPRPPKQSSSKGLSLTEPTTIRERGKSFAKSVKEDLQEIRKKSDYLQFTQMRRLLRRLKEIAEKNERRLKSKDQSGPGEKGEAGHREAQNSTTKPEGGTENLEDDPKNWGAPSSMFVGRGSGRIG